MSRKWTAIVAGLAMVVSTTAFAQDEGGSGTTTPNAPISSSSDITPTSSDATSPNAPVQAAEEGPVAGGAVAGTSTAAGFALGTTGIVAIGAVAVAAAVCIAACGGSHSNSTTTTSPK